MKVNKSLYYLLPLIEGWSETATPPLNSYAKSRIKDSIILEYENGGTPHGGIKIAETDKHRYIACKIDPEFIDDYKIILKGEYSKISEIAKNRIISRAHRLEDSQRIEKILYKTKSLKKYLEKFLSIEDIDKLTEEYDSKMFHEEHFNFIKYNETITNGGGEAESVEV